LLTEEEENGIRERMIPVSASFSLNSTHEIAVQTERYHDSQEHAEYEETLRAALDERPIARSRAWMRSQFLAEAANSIPRRSLPPLLPFIPLTSRLVCRRKSI
jgi:hypothetical protein